MKYLIKESRLESTIERYIKSNYPLVDEVRFEKKQKMCGSEYPSRRVTENVIVVIFHKLNKSIFQGDMENDYNQIYDDLDDLFNLNFSEYCSEWSLVGKK